MLEFHEHRACLRIQDATITIKFPFANDPQHNASGHGIELITDYITARAHERETLFSQDS